MQLADYCFTLWNIFIAVMSQSNAPIQTQVGLRKASENGVSLQLTQAESQSYHCLFYPSASSKDHMQDATYFACVNQDYLLPSEDVSSATLSTLTAKLQEQ